MDKSAEIECLEAAYLALLRMPHGATRMNSEPLLCGLRDALAVELGRDPQQVQDEYGVKAFATSPARQAAQPVLLDWADKTIAASAIKHLESGGLTNAAELFSRLMSGATQIDARRVRDEVLEEVANEIRALQSQSLPSTEKDAEDARRYRWLRDPNTDVALVLDKQTGWVPPDDAIPGVGGYHTYEYRAGEELDAAIDAAIAQKESGNDL